ncbi:efflux RND transporter periplasmic adaptor subunit [Anoxybacteroides rupiense]|uniref:efflux RND transporter periplasmic adaptor subunit n=1 Tax=Anoxybacteroides rupiense TaxID=311460 RepID=UPI001F096EBF|nr:efflux RND transporter periplasmic adaptor subunit [Anoxybacillus rupiensis]
MKKWIVIFIVAIVVIGGGVWIWSMGKKDTVVAQTPTASVQKGKLEVKVSGNGTIQPVTSEDLKAKANKEVDEVLVSEGEKVTEGQELITFTDGSDPITAPAAGTVTSVAVEPGQRVTIGQVVAHLTNYDDLQVTVQIDELDILKIKAGQTASVKINAFPNTTYSGKVTSIANEGTVSNGVSTFDVTVHLDKSTNVKVGMTAEASILVESKDNVLYVPIEAVNTINGQKFVVVTDPSSSENGEATRRQIIKTGINNEDYVEITEGLEEGEIVQLPRTAVTSSNMNNRMEFGGMMNRMPRMNGAGGMGGRSYRGGE